MLNAASVKVGSLPTFAAFAHKIKTKLESQRRQCGHSSHSPHLSIRQNGRFAATRSITAFHLSGADTPAKTAPI
jgi:hypothetical protein